MAYRFIDFRVPFQAPRPTLMQGFTRNITSTWRQCAEGAENGDFFQCPTADVDVDISSDSGSANQTVLVIGFNAAGNPVVESAVLNGQTRVQLAQQFFRIKLVTLLASTQSAEPYMDNNEDFIYVYDRTATVTAGKPDGFFGCMDLGKGISKQGFWYVPAGTHFAFVSGIINMDTSGGVREIRMVVQWRNTNDLIWKTIVETVFANGISNFPLDCTPTLFDANYGIDIRLSVQLQSGSTTNSSLVALHAIEETAI